MFDLRAVLTDRFVSARAAARSGHYQLFLGAGASFGAKNRLGHSLPGSEGLVLLLQQRFPDARIDPSLQLQRAYQRAVLSGGANAVYQVLRDVFGKADHFQWFRRMASNPWRRVWTLNIDDTFERSYKIGQRARYATLRSQRWTDEYAESNGVEIVHLHGDILSQQPTPLIFSMSEYQASAEAHGVWHQVLRGLLSSEPFVIVGAKVLGDQDVEALVLGARPSNNAPSMIVDPLIDDGAKWELEQAGFVVIKESAQSWFEAWEAAFDLDDAGLGTIYQSSAVNVPQLLQLRAESVAPPSDAHDFLGGSEPIWADARNELIAKFDWISRCADRTSSWVNSAAFGVRVEVLYADRLAGMTSGLMVLASLLVDRHYTVMLFDRSTRFDPALVLDFCRAKGPVVILIDGVHEFAFDVDELAEQAAKDPLVKLQIICADRPYRDLKIEDQLRGNYPKSAERVQLRRSRADARTISTLLKRFGRLGKLERVEFRDAVEHFTNRDIFSSLSEIEHSAGFKLRLDREVAGLSTPWHRDLLLLLALASLENNPVGLTEAGFALSLSTVALQRAISTDAHLSALVELNSEVLQPRQRERGLGSLVAAGREFNFLSRLSYMLINLAPIANSSSLKNRNRATSLVGRLMNARQLREIFPEGDFVSFYQSLLPTYGDWNARYWEQRAIDAKARGDWGQAESFAERAVSLNDDPFTRTTLGTILLNKATSLASEGDPAWPGYYSRGFESLKRAIEGTNRNRVSAFAFLENSLSLIRVLTERQSRGLDTFGQPQIVESDWEDIYVVMRVGLSRDDGFGTISRMDRISKQYQDLTSSGVKISSTPSTLGVLVPNAIKLEPMAFKSESVLPGPSSAPIVEQPPSVVPKLSSVIGAPVDPNLFSVSSGPVGDELRSIADSLEAPITFVDIASRVNRTLGPPSVHKWDGASSLSSLIRMQFGTGHVSPLFDGLLVPPFDQSGKWAALTDPLPMLNPPPGFVTELRKTIGSIRPSGRDGALVRWVIEALADSYKSGDVSHSSSRAQFEAAAKRSAIDRGRFLDAGSVWYIAREAKKLSPREPDYVDITIAFGDALVRDAQLGTQAKRAAVEDVAKWLGD